MSLPPLTLAEWDARDLPTPDFLLGTMLSTTNRMIIAAPTGIGKTGVAIATGFRIAAGKPFLHWSGSGLERRVLYVDGEMSRRLLRQRLRSEVQRLGSSPRGFHALCAEDINDFKPLNTPQGQSYLLSVIEELGGIDLIIFDNIMSLVSGSMIDEVPWAETMPFVRSLTRRSIGQVWIHHTGHNESRAYGTKTREWQMDTVAILDQVKRPDTDVSFRLSFSKARERAPYNRSEFQPVEIALVDDAWVHKSLEVADAGHPAKVAPKAKHFLAVLKEAAKAPGADSHKGIDNRVWRTACGRAGLVDPDGKPDGARSQFSKYRKKLADAGMIATDGERSWPKP